MKEQHRILKQMLDILLSNSTDTSDAVEKMLQWIAYNIGVDPGMVSPTLKLEQWEAIREIDLSILTQEPADHIGEFIKSYCTDIPDSDFYHLDASYIERRLTNISTAVQEMGFKSFIDPCGGTGGLMIALREKFGGEIMVYVSEPSVMMYHVAIINAKLFNIPSRIIHADYRVHDIEEGSLNWRYAGMWTPPQWKHLILAKTGS